MKYEFAGFDPDHFSTNMHRNTVNGNLTWDNSPGQSVFVFQSAFGEDLMKRTNEICRALEIKNPEREKYIEIIPNIWIREVTAADKARDSGCPLNHEACRYTVLSFTRVDDQCRIYAPQTQSMMPSFADVPVEMHVEVIQQIRTAGNIFKKKQYYSGFYEITFQGNTADKYTEGTLGISVGGYEIPVTREMVKRGTIYIKSETRPEVFSLSQGIKLK